MTAGQQVTTAYCKRGCIALQPYLLFITFGARRQDTAFNSPPDNKPKNVIGYFMTRNISIDILADTTIINL